MNTKNNHEQSIVGPWVREKHAYLQRYINTARKTRQKYLPPLGRGGATYIDLFCGSGQASIRGSSELVDGSAVVAWKASVEGGAPFSQIFINDSNSDLLAACTEKLQKLGAPVTGYCLPAHEAVIEIVKEIKQRYPHGLHFAFVDPFNLALNFEIIQQLASCNRMDMLVHLSAMDLQRNLESNLKADESTFDILAPGWREAVDTLAPPIEIRRRIVEFWRSKIESLGVWPSQQHKLITGEKNQPLYWLLLAAKHELAHDFWEVASNPEGQGSLFG
ncbi:three-Cys-motif partner protein TcmP [Limnohabitans sp.]|uniref:three-Cys-motif partner protein TcmP n=1 Tax=Limnohabitans sp. TaxID=1907725 RepID=UPI00286F4E7B|nr:three-Cys-motif partner protein TcmP [Limnohabitans sp.]